MMVIIYILGVLVYCVLPYWLQLPLLLINTFVPDPIPYIDEIIMYGSMVKKMVNAGKILAWIDEHRFLTGIIILVLVVIIIMMIV